MVSGALDGNNTNLKFFIDADQLSGLLKTMTLKQAALHLKIPYSSVHSFCKKRGLKSSIHSKRGRVNKTEQRAKDVIEYYLAGMSQQQIADKIGLSRTTVAALLKTQQQELRTQSQAAKLRDSALTPEQRIERARAANAVRHALAIVRGFSF